MSEQEEESDEGGKGKRREGRGDDESQAPRR